MQSEIKERVREFWRKYETEIILFFAGFFVSLISFLLGFYLGKNFK